MNPRTPHRPRANVRPDEADSSVQEQLGALIVLAELLLLDLCVVRTAMDLLRRSMSVEGDIALALAVVLVASLVRKAVRTRRLRAGDN